ncbi:MAG: NmrA family NAD(P)-binding protein [Tepidisphaeraceae bacterium]|jgi:uncharacterized protein YbjT (DUF2867 family)
MYAITGATGHTGNFVARRLLQEGQQVRAIGRDQQRLGPLIDAGAEPFVCDLADAAALSKAFGGAQAAYIVIPPDMSSKNYRAYQDRIADSVASALTAAGVQFAVTLSSVGADKADKTGPVVGLHNLEKRLSAIDDLNVVHLRAGYFMENTLAQAGIIHAMGQAAGPLRPNLKISMVATRDIGQAAAEILLQLNFTGQHTRELLGQRDLTMTEVTRIIGGAIGKPDLKYVQLPDNDFRNALTQMGMPTDFANLILEMAGAMNSGHMRALESRSAGNTTPTSYETFVAEDFVPVYEGRMAHV